MKKIFLASIFPIMLVVPNVHAEIANENVVTAYPINDYKNCAYGMNGGVVLFNFWGYPNYKGPVTATTEKRVPPRDFQGMPALTSGGAVSCSGVEQSYIYPENHRPTAHYTVKQENKWTGGTNRVTISSDSTDMDEGYLDSLIKGNISKYTWRVNGVVQTSTSSNLIIYTSLGGNYTIELEVVDSGVKYAHPNANRWINEGEPFFKLKNTYSRVVELEPWTTCNRCVID
jgi:hypothetical protein